MAQVTLIDGEQVKVKMDNMADENHVAFMRMSDELIISIVSGPPRSAVYVWQKAGEEYDYLGDISFWQQEDGSTKWNVYPCVPRELKDQAAKFLANQFSANSRRTNVNLLSKVLV